MSHSCAICSDLLQPDFDKLLDSVITLITKKLKIIEDEYNLFVNRVAGTKLRDRLWNMLQFGPVSDVLLGIWSVAQDMFTSIV
jgi:hypothetical protein